MIRAPIRSTVFNLAFYVISAACCLLCLPALILPRRWFLAVVQAYHYIIIALEYGILNLRYEVRGQEHLPPQGAYLVAAKHMSAYETLKLRLLFKDPAIVLKKELLQIPLWGTFLKKTDVIAIDRTNPDSATASIRDGALRMKDQGRPIIIFPQGTRVWPHETAQNKRYKSGIYRMHAATDLPIVPMATNSGLFWPRRGWLKSPGTVVFEFLPPIAAGHSKEQVMSRIEHDVETRSLALMDEARKKNKTRSKLPRLWAFVLFPLLILVGGTSYTLLWHRAALYAGQQYEAILQHIGAKNSAPPVISGFPGPIRLYSAAETLSTPNGTITFNNINIYAWPLPVLPVNVTIDNAHLKSVRWRAPLNLQTIYARLQIRKNIIHVLDSHIYHDHSTAQIRGSIDTQKKPLPHLDLMVSGEHHGDFLQHLANNGIINKNMALFMTAGMSTFSDADGVIHVPIIQRGNALYAGPVPLIKFGAPFE